MVRAKLCSDELYVEAILCLKAHTCSFTSSAVTAPLTPASSVRVVSSLLVASYAPQQVVSMIRAQPEKFLTQNGFKKNIKP